MTTLTQVLGQRPAASIGDVVRMMTAIDASVPEDDGLSSRTSKPTSRQSS